MPFHEIEVFAMREKILVLEDDDNLRQLVVESLEDMNQSFQIVDVHRPELAIDAARHTRFDLMLTDVRMAGFTDGLGALEEVKKHCPNIYSIVMTGFMEFDKPEVRAMRCGTDFFLKKPFDLKKLENAIIQVLATKQSSDTIQNQVKGFFNSAKRSLMKLTGKEVEKETTELERDRSLFFNAYFTAIQTTTLDVSGAIQVWDYLIAFEREHEDLLIDVGPPASELASKYRRLLEFCADLTEKRTPAKIPPRDKNQIGVPLFSQFYERVREGDIPRPYLNRAPAVWNLTKDIENQIRAKPSDKEWPKLFSKIFGEDPVAKAERQKQERSQEQQRQIQEQLRQVTQQIAQKEPTLREIRQTIYTDFYEAIRTDQLTPFSTLWIWDTLIGLEIRPTDQDISKYQTLRSYLSRLITEKPQRSSTPRANFQIPIPLLTHLCHQIRHHHLPLQRFAQAPGLWILHQQIQRKIRVAPPQWPDPFRLLFGSNPPP